MKHINDMNDIISHLKTAKEPRQRAYYYSLFCEHINYITKAICTHVCPEIEVDQKEMLDLCLRKLNKFNGKGKAFSYFTTIIVCRIRQILMASKRS